MLNSLRLCKLSRSSRPFTVPTEVRGMTLPLLSVNLSFGFLFMRPTLVLNGSPITWTIQSGSTGIVIKNQSLPFRIRRRRWYDPRGVPQFFQDHFNGPVKLLIVAGVFLGRIVIDDNVGIHTMPPDDPFLAFLALAGEFWFFE